MLNLYYYYMFCLFIFGLMVGSFLNVCIFRIPKNETIVTIPSHCTSCNHQLKWYDLFPLFSYIFLRGKCRYCKTKISPQYPLVEFLNAVSWVAIYYLFGGLSVMTVVYCLFISALIVLSVIDIREGIVPDRINIFIFVLGLIVLAFDYQNWSNHVIGFFAVSIPLLLPLFIGGMGGGDVKLYAVCGFIIGWKLIIVALIVTCIIASIYGIFIIIKDKATGKTPVRLVPFITMGIIITLFYGEQIINWYITTFFTF